MTGAIERDMSVSEIQTRLTEAEGWVDRLYREGGSLAVVSEFPGSPLSIVVRRKSDEQWSDPESPRQLGHYKGKSFADQLWRRYGYMEAFVRSGDRAILAPVFPTRFPDPKTFGDTVGFRIVEPGFIPLYHPIHSVAYFYGSMLTGNPGIFSLWHSPLLEFEEQYDPSTLKTRTIVKFIAFDSEVTDLRGVKHDMTDYEVDVYWGDQKAGTVDTNTAPGTVLLDTTWADAKHASGSSRYTIRHTILMARDMYNARGNTSRRDKLSSFASSHGYTKHVYDPCFNRTYQDEYYLWDKACWHDGDVPPDREAEAHSWGLSPYRYAYESKMVALGMWLFNLLGPSWASETIARLVGGFVWAGTLFGEFTPELMGLLFDIPAKWTQDIGAVAGAVNDGRLIWTNLAGYQATYRALQALNVALYHGVDHEYCEPKEVWNRMSNGQWQLVTKGKPITPRQVAEGDADIERAWNGWGWTTWQPGKVGGLFFAKNPRVAAMWCTAPIAIFYTIMGYKFNIPKAKQWADVAFKRALCEAQWGVYGSSPDISPWGEYQTMGPVAAAPEGASLVCRPANIGGGQTAWHPRLLTGAEVSEWVPGGGKWWYANNFGRAWTVEVNPYPFDMPQEASDALPANSEATLLYWQALRTYLYWRHNITWGSASTIPGAS